MVKVLHQKHFDAFVTLVSKTESMHNRWEPAEEFVRLMKKQPGIDYRAGFLNGAIGDVMHFGKLSFQANSPRGGTIYVQHRQKTILAYDRSKHQKLHFYFVSREEQHFEVEEPIQNFQQMRELHESTMYWKMYNPQSKKKRRLESAASSHQGKQQQDTKSPAASTGNVVAPDSSLPTHQSRQQTMQASATWWAPMLIPQSAYVTGLNSTIVRSHGYAQQGTPLPLATTPRGASAFVPIQNGNRQTQSNQQTLPKSPTLQAPVAVRLSPYTQQHLTPAYSMQGQKPQQGTQPSGTGVASISPPDTSRPTGESYPQTVPAFQAPMAISPSTFPQQPHLTTPPLGYVTISLLEYVTLKNSYLATHSGPSMRKHGV